VERGRMSEKFKFLEHTADAKFQAFGKTLDKTFENAALAMFNVMYKGKVKKTGKYKIKVKGSDKESLLYNFLEELLFLLDTKSFFLSSAKVKITDNMLEAEVSGDSAKNYKVMTDVKAVTYNEMFIKHEKDMWICQVVVDV
jgi:SHS2 domain-containing protein